MWAGACMVFVWVPALCVLGWAGSCQNRFWVGAFSDFADFEYRNPVRF